VIRSLLALDGVLAVCQFRDDGSLVEGYGVIPDAELTRLARFARDYRRMLQGNADQLSMFTQMPGWTPPRGWIVRGAANTVYSFANVVCLADNAETSMAEVMAELREVAQR
jgi:roadblock/LC7 domain-containing protein